MARPLPTSEQRLKNYVHRGWSPVRWAHLPPEVKALYRRLGRVPQMKACWFNVQMLHRVAKDLPDLVYCEGWIHRIIPIDHAWLKFRGQIIDPTMGGEQTAGDRNPISYPEGQSYVVPWDEVRRELGRTGFYGPIRPRQLMEVGPYHELMMEFNRKQQEGTR